VGFGAILGAMAVVLMATNVLPALGCIASVVIGATIAAFGRCDMRRRPESQPMKRLAWRLQWSPRDLPPNGRRGCSFGSVHRAKEFSIPGVF